jgi:hypothetical protein
MPLKMTQTSNEKCSNFFGFNMRPTEQRVLKEAAKNARMSQANYLRSRIPEIFEPAKPGRRWPADCRTPDGVRNDTADGAAA